MSVNSTQQASQPSSGRPKEVIKITVECLKSFGIIIDVTEHYFGVGPEITIAFNT